MCLSPRECVRMLTCMYVRMYECMYACMHVCMYACVHVCMCACVHVCMYACMHVCMHACMHAWMYVCMYVCVYTYRYVCVCVCVCVCVLRGCLCASLLHEPWQCTHEPVFMKSWSLPPVLHRFCLCRTPENPCTSPLEEAPILVTLGSK